MDNQRFDAIVREVFAGLEEKNHTHLPREDVTIPIVDAPIYGFAAADDPIFETFRDPEINGPNWLGPKERMPEAQTVAVFFFAFSEEVRSRHRVSTELMDEAWVNGYGDHGNVLVPFAQNITAALEAEGVRVMNPTWDMEHPAVSAPVDNKGEEDLHWSAPWSTRHVAFAAGLGTFGVHRHLITEKGCCGAMVTLLLDCALEPTKRPYTDPYEYCTHCGACTRRCPVNAISLERLRNLKKCSEHTAKLFKEFKKGNCGKCMVGVPCEDRIPGRAK
ncbi:MAG: 4Fe-4S binding protein [Oscillospiraceae bacterium]|jgi:epoxyqueuosine reductase QueG|nr:4Fe-4S binding protein [Oscillospiraceae bacterium]